MYAIPFSVLIGSRLKFFYWSTELPHLHLLHIHDPVNGLHKHLPVGGPFVNDFQKLICN
ncbi:ORF67 [Duck adenovirus 3]|uniref:ORF67 n=3 Tax=Duck aviadenovirus B TaxID=1534553 RepID=A0A5F2P0N2_9ADEN|nr:ORF67 [Duck adenovirus 2]AYH52278.1 ORF67 [Duck adenovirus 3]QKW90003.1 ORF67 [Duck aviadenovirus B]AYH52310.1 ORF67 [Duck adenovirus 3]AYH52338.1 ORF67 [Duck adenovirus 3]